MNPNPWLRECPKVVLNMTTTTTATGTTSRILKKKCAIGQKYRSYFTDFDRLLIYAAINTLYLVWSSFMNLFINQFINQLYITMNGSTCIDKIFHVYIHYIWLYLHLFRCQFYLYVFRSRSWSVIQDMNIRSQISEVHISQHPCKKLQCDQMCLDLLFANKFSTQNRT